MRRSALAVLAPTVLLLAACGGTSEEEEQFLADLQERGSLIELSDPDGDLRQGYEVCTALEETKPEDRYLGLGILDQRLGFSRDVIDLAQEHLCPEIDVPGPSELYGTG